MQGCEYAIPREGVEPLQEFQDFQEILNAARDNIASLMDDFSSIGLDVLTNNLEYDATEVQSMLIEIRANIQELADDLISLIDTLVCEHIHGIYEKVIHDATCTKSYDGLAWTFSSLLIMVFFGFLMLQFRSAMYPLAGLERDGDYSWNEAKETDIASANTNINGDEPGYKLEDAPASSVQDEDLQSNGQREEEVPMGGTAQQRYDDVGDANPSAEAPGQQENFVPRKSAWA